MQWDLSCFEAFTQLAARLSRSSRPDGVNPILRELLQRKDANARSHADSAEALGGLARAYHANHFRESAKLAYQLAARLAPNDYRWFYCQALLEEDSAEPGPWLNYWKELSNFRTTFLPTKNWRSIFQRR